MVALNTQLRCPKFPLGRVVATPGALAALQQSGESPAKFLSRHVAGDWGDVCADDAKANDEAVSHEGDFEQQARVLSSYLTASGDKLWVITEADRSSTCFLLPTEY
jgi:hypothetical protein